MQGLFAKSMKSDEEELSRINNEISAISGYGVGADRSRLEQLFREKDAVEQRLKVGRYDEDLSALERVQLAAQGIGESYNYMPGVLVDTAVGAMKGEKVDMNSDAIKGMQRANQAAQQATYGMGDGAAFLFNTGASIAENASMLPLAMLPGGQAAVLGMMGAKAAAQKIVDVGEKGGSAKSALLRGLGSGAIEAATEKLPLDNLTKLIKGDAGKSIIKNMLIQAGQEATEEGVAYLGNLMLDKAAKDPDAKFSLQELGASMLAGGISGGVMGGGASLVGNNVRRNNVAETKDGNIAADNNVGAKNAESAINTENIDTAGAINAADINVGNVNGDVSVVAKLKNSIPQLTRMETLKKVEGTEFEDDGTPLVGRIMKFFSKYGNKINRSGFGDVIISKSKINTSLRHGMGRAKISAFTAVPEIIANGKEIDITANWKNRGYDTHIFAGPVEIAGQKSYLAVVVTKSPADNRYYLHEVVDQDGNFVQIKKDDSMQSSTTGLLPNGSTSESTLSSINNISQTAETDNGNVLQSNAKSAERKALEDEVKRIVGIDTRTEAEKVAQEQQSKVAMAQEWADKGIAPQEDVERLKASAVEKVSEAKAKESLENAVKLIEYAGKEADVYSDNRDRAAAYNTAKRIGINLAHNDTTAMGRAVHEVGHDKTATKEWTDYTAALDRLIATDGRLVKLMEDIDYAYRNSEDAEVRASVSFEDGSFNNSKIREEQYLKLTEIMLPNIAKGDKQLLDAIKKDRNVIDNLLDFIRGIKNKVSIKLTKSEAAMLDEAERQLVNLLRSEGPQSEDGKRYSVEYDADNKPYIVIDDDILQGVPESDWINKVKEVLASRSVLMEKFAVAINADTRSEYTKSKYSQKLERKDKQRYAEKFRMVNNLDEIIRNAYNTRNEDAIHKNFESFNRGFIDVRISNFDYSIEVVTGINKTNHEIMYDIVNIQPTKIKDANPMGAKSPKTSNASSINNVPQTNKNGNGKNLSKNNGKRFSYGGIKADNIPNGFLRADRLAEFGTDNETIRQETGWFIGADGKWRFEIDDSKMQIDTAGRLHRNPDIRKRMQLFEDVYLGGDDSKMKELQVLEQNLKGVSFTPQRLGDMISHPDLFKHYPELADKRVEFKDLPAGHEGGVDKKEDKIVLNKSLRTDERRLKRTLIHEIQHCIQIKEGFAGGANVKYWEENQRKGNMQIAKRYYEKYQKAKDAFLSNVYHKSVEYEKLCAKLETTRWNTEEYDSIMSQIGERLYEDFPENKAEKLMDEVLDWGYTMDVYKGYSSGTKESPRNLYFGTAGEQESRDVERRLDYTVEQRQAEKPFTGDNNTVFVEGASAYESVVDHIISVSGKDYGKGVYLDSGYLEGLTEAEQKKMVAERVKELGGRTFTAYDNNRNPVDVKIAAKGVKFRNKRGKRVDVSHDLGTKNNDIEMKRQAVVVSDELLEAADFVTTEPARHAHDWLDNNGLNDWDVWTVFMQEKNNSVWSADLKIANSANGEKYLYDIVQIKMVEGGGKSPHTTTSNKISHFTENDNGNNLSDNLKEKQFELVTAANPMRDNYHTGIRSVDDIKTFAEAMEDDESCAVLLIYCILDCVNKSL